ncbi:hypothetical protein [Nonomuraea sp. NPDC049480]|uniref:hypothetical protein n=1 Tax=Nonomuraea sp. NPDC049480 TaxID=3364353 RepID=UPI00378BBBF9
MDERDRDVVQHRHVREEIEVLKHHLDPGPDRILGHPAIDGPHTVEDDSPVAGPFQQVDARQQGRLEPMELIQAPILALLPGDGPRRETEASLP